MKLKHFDSTPPSAALIFTYVFQMIFHDRSRFISIINTHRKIGATKEVYFLAPLNTSCVFLGNTQFNKRHTVYSMFQFSHL